jgi:hypothetical protein|tara:strand:+ start:2867 stop:3595 length:729 start_codon:yes stop_codon:yes gene_type:complete
MEPIKELKGKTVAIVGMGASWLDYNLAKSHGSHFDEVWAINAVGTVIFHDRVFMMDPPSRFLDSDDAGGQTEGMRTLLTDHNKPIYTCEMDKRCKNLQLYPINEVLRDLQSSYLNNTVAYAIAFALWNEVAVLKVFGIDFTYKGNLYFAEAGRGCVEFWLSKCMMAGMTVEVANSSTLLDASVPLDEKLYGYHRLEDPLVPVINNGVLSTKRVSEGEKKEVEQKPVLIGRHENIKVGEPNKW